MRLSINGVMDFNLGYTSIGNKAGYKFDIVHDPNVYPWPIESNTVEQVYINQYLQVPDNLENFLEELYRVCTHKAVCQAVSVYATNVRAHCDPYAKRVISDWTMVFYDKDFRKINNMPPCNFNFKIMGVSFGFNDYWQSRSEETREFAKQHYWNTVEDIMIQMEVVKE